MITMYVDYKLVENEYIDESKKLISILRDSESKYKNTDINKTHWAYSFSYFIKKSDNTPEYYEELYNMPFNERLEIELKKVRVNLSLSAGYFYISDRVDKISDTIKMIVERITAQKMINEQETIGNEDVINSIPTFSEDVEPKKPSSLQDQLKVAIEMEDYLEAARIRDEINKQEN